MKLKIAFESGKLTYSQLPVDLYNSGVNQILSIAASRGHEIFHFSADGLFTEREKSYARMSDLKLSRSFGGEDISAYRHLEKVGEEVILLSEIDIFMLRADDVKPSTPNLELLRQAEKDSIFLENIEDTLTTCDKYETIERCPDIPQPVTYASSGLEDALSKIKRLPSGNGSFILKDRFGYGCGAQVHRLRFEDPEMPTEVEKYIKEYKDIIVQEFCPEVEEGDIVVTFFDGEMVAPMQRIASPGEWKTNASLGATELEYRLDSGQEEIARKVVNAFPGCRFASVDMLKSGKVLEINAFPGGDGLYQIYGISVGKLIMDRLEKEARDNIRYIEEAV